MTWFKLGLVAVFSTLLLTACIKKEQPEQEAQAASDVVETQEQEVILQEQPSIEEIPTEEPTASVRLTEVEPPATATTDTDAIKAPVTRAESTDTADAFESNPPAAKATAANTESAEDDPIAQALKAAQPALNPAQ